MPDDTMPEELTRSEQISWGAALPHAQQFWPAECLIHLRTIADVRAELAGANRRIGALEEAAERKHHEWDAYRRAALYSRATVCETLKMYRCQHTSEDDGGGMPLADMLTPPTEGQVDMGLRELELLADEIAGDIADKARAALKGK